MSATSIPHRPKTLACRRLIVWVAVLLTCLGPSEGLASATNARRALDALSTSITQVRAGDYAGARSALQGVETIVKLQSAAITTFEGQASSAFQGCVAAVGELDRKLGEIVTTEQRVAQDLRATEGALNNAVKDGQVSAAEIKSIQQQLAAAQASIRARQEKLKELEKWWWVPGYGFYLAIRTLADNDVGEMQSLARTLQEHQVQQQRSEQALRTAQSAQARLASERSRLQAEQTAAAALRTSLDQRMAAVRQVTAFASDAKQFWANLDTFIAYQVEGAVGSTQVLADALSETLGKQGPDVLVLGIGSEQANLRSKLLDLADKLERGEGYTALSRTACAPGAGASPSQVKTCQISVAWPHYEIVDPLKCSFRYVNPPGCPPAIASHLPTPMKPGEFAQRARENDLKLKARSLAADDQNWIGLARCTSPEALYLGRVANVATCAAACFNNPACQFWTYNVRNGMIGGTPTECWGGTRNLVPTAGKWGGFVSGGVPCLPGQTPSTQGLCTEARTARARGGQHG